MRLLAATLVASALLLGCSAFGRGVVRFEGTSMQPGIKHGDRLIVLRFDQGAEFDVKRGDVILFLYPKDPEKSYLKRLVGLPGETVELRGGRVFINGQELAEPYVDPQLNAELDSRPPVYVEPHHYYVLGDNRDNSADSRLWGAIPEKYILGKVLNE
ncbi:MAG TPA: signal peptidase I [Pyrinomonadaceae bacterium]|jgi:signal peptidase I